MQGAGMHAGTFVVSWGPSVRIDNACMVKMLDKCDGLIHVPMTCLHHAAFSNVCIEPYDMLHEHERHYCMGSLTTELTIHLQRRMHIRFSHRFPLLNNLKVIILMRDQYLIVVLRCFFQHILLESVLHVFYPGPVNACMQDRCRTQDVTYVATCLMIAVAALHMNCNR